ncbi:hypothetical protein DSUL_20035 [Desulfovibrionales bacterium]
MRGTSSCINPMKTRTIVDLRQEYPVCHLTVTDYNDTILAQIGPCL